MRLAKAVASRGAAAALRVLLISPRPLAPVRHGHVYRSRQLLRALVELGHTVRTLEIGTLKQLVSDPELDALGVERHLFSLPFSGTRLDLFLRSWFSRLPAQEALFALPELVRVVRRLASVADAAILTLVRLGGLLSALEKLPVVVDLVDSLSLQAEGRARFDRPWLRPFWRVEAKRLLAAERQAIERSAESWLVSPRDQGWLLERIGTSAGVKLKRVPIVCGRSDEGAPAEAAREFRLVITGNLGYFPTREGLKRWLRTAWPEVLRAHPDTSLLLAGSRLPRGLRRGGWGRRVRLEEEPADLGSLLRTGSAAIVPLWTGSGVPLKLLSAWSHGVPVVATPWAAVGAAGVPGEDHLEADLSSSWVEAISAIRSDPRGAEKLREGGWLRLQQKWSWESLMQSLLACRILRS